MSNHVILVERPADIRWQMDDQQVMTVRDYITRPDAVKSRATKIINLTRSYSYLGHGYYASLLAQARGHKIIPSVRTILDLEQKQIYRFALPELDEMLRARMRRLRHGPDTSFMLHLFFGTPDDSRFQDLGRAIFDQFRAPILRVKIKLQEDWSIGAIELLNFDDLTQEQEDAFQAALAGYTRTSWREPSHIMGSNQPSLAILYNPKDPTAPSDAKAIQKFIKAGEALNVEVEIIEKKDFLHLAEFDALFIRETTAIDNHTYRFAKKAEKEGMPVIDDSTSILKCTNKVFLAELLKANKIAAPKTIILDKSRINTVEREITYPIVLKIPDGSNSRGVFKVSSAGELRATAETLFEESDLILAQEFLHTDFDWRVGVLNGQPIYVSQYFMAKKYWKITRHHPGGGMEDSGWKTMPVEEAPHAVINTAVKAAALIGNGLYGVDLKQTDKGIVVIEVNDNPSIDTGCEDAVLRDDLYKLIIREFLRRLEQPQIASR